MAESIIDGTGEGGEARVFRKRLWTSSVSQSTLSSVSETDGNVYGVTTPFLTQTTTGGAMLYIKNTSSSLNFHIDSIRVYYDGGATNYNKVIEATLTFGDGAPTGNNTAGSAGNLSLVSSNTASMDVAYWDEVGDGMTITGGTDALYGIVDKGQSMLEIDGAIILGNGNTLTLSFKASEIGEACINILGYYE